MQDIIEMAKAHLQNVASKIQELDGQRRMLETEIEKLNSYLKEGIMKVEAAAKQDSN
jgi:hypothetical protein